MVAATKLDDLFAAATSGCYDYIHLFRSVADFVVEQHHFVVVVVVLVTDASCTMVDFEMNELWNVLVNVMDFDDKIEVAATFHVLIVVEVANGKRNGDYSVIMAMVVFGNEVYAAVIDDNLVLTEHQWMTAEEVIEIDCGLGSSHEICM